MSSQGVMIKFGFEDLEVWQKAVTFAEIVINFAEKINTNHKHYRLIEQLESASTSISLNIAEGKGRHSRKEFVQFLYIARGSLYETVTLLIVFHSLNWIDDKQLDELKQSGDEIGKMLSALIKNISN
jgi:four helix bundle protein